jgi:hypothetical protein
VKIWDTTHKRLIEFSETKETSIAEVIDKAVTRYMGHISDRREIELLKAELEKLKSQSPQRTKEEVSQDLLESGGCASKEPAEKPQEPSLPSTTALAIRPVPLGTSSRALTNTSENTKITASGTMTTSTENISSHFNLRLERQEQALMFAQKLANIKVDMNRRIQEEKRETIREMQTLREMKRPQGRGRSNFEIEEQGYGGHFNFSSEA